MGTRLYRSRRDRMLAGVAGGLAELWGADASLIRIIWALLVIATGGLALVVYIVMAVVVPDEDEAYPGGVPGRIVTSDPGSLAPSRTAGGGLSAGVLVGGFLILLGGFFLIREFLPRIDFDWFWPLALVALGVVLIVSAMGRGRRRLMPPPPSTTPPALPPPPPGPEEPPAP
jgi:phage shock protein C